MDVTIAISIVGLALTVWGIALAIKNTKYPGEITFIREQTISLFEDIVKNIPDLKVLYKDNPIPTNIVLIKGALLNTGKKDISPSIVDKPINISTNKNFKWISIQSVSASENVHGNFSIAESKELVINMGLFRCNEYIRFQALLQVPLDEIMKDNKGFRKISIEDQIWNYITFDHRIEGTRPIKKINAENVQYNKIIEKPLIVIAAILLVMLSVLWFLGDNNKFVYRYKPDQSDSITVEIGKIKENSIEIYNVDKNYKETVNRILFFSKCNHVPLVIKDYGNRREAAQIAIFMGIFYAIIILSRFRNNRIYNKTVKLLNK